MRWYLLGAAVTIIVALIGLIATQLWARLAPRFSGLDPLRWVLSFQGDAQRVKPVSRQCDAADWRQVRPCHGPADDESAATVYESVVSPRAGTPTESRCNPATVTEAEIRMPRALGPITVKGRRDRLAGAPRDVPPGGQVEGCAPVPVAGDVAHVESRCVEKCADVIPGEEPPPSLVGNPTLAIEAPS